MELIEEFTIKKQKEVINNYDAFFTYSEKENEQVSLVEFSMTVEPRSILITGAYTSTGQLNINSYGIVYSEISMITDIIAVCNNIMQPI